ncbi:hypothetical protein KW846_28660 [Pseudomonas sp. PDM32]|uniref:hypothetical protein n=1 Tax=Pseudomonas sp. PDM32 TaxID=2854768 RepID=UPI001C468A5C|nr:hypothetical protein [Pseudomonas sp. PDM32]MBV7576696.1 hypothetical protein [Pseudomonas sp. PDM32]
MEAMVARRTGKTLFVYTLLLVAGCSHHSDIELDRNHADGVTAKGTQAYIACIKHELTSGTKTFTVENSGSINLFIGSIDPTTAAGLVELSRVNGQTTYSVNQRHAWVDKGRLINAAQECSKD